MRAKSNQKLIKQINLVKVFQAIREQGPISRAEIAKNHRLSPTTVSSLTEELIAMDLVETTGIGESSGGRRPVMLKYKPNSRFTIGVDINDKNIAVGCCNLNGQVIEKITFSPDYSNAKNLIAGAIYGIRQILSKVGPDPSRLLGIGIAIPGLLDKKRTSLIYSASLALKDVPLLAGLQQQLNYPISIENDMNAAAFGEHLLGSGRNADNLIYISVARGIGAGIIIDGKIFPGGSGNAGELGHMGIDPNGPLCECGNKGCLGVMATEPAFLSKAVHMLSLSIPTKLKSLTHNNLSNVSLAVIKQAIDEEDPVALKILEENMNYLGMGIANLFAIFDPSLIILGGEVIDFLGEPALDAVRKSVGKYTILPDYYGKNVRIVPGSLGEDAMIIGAASLIFSKFLDTLQA